MLNHESISVVTQTNLEGDSSQGDMMSTDDKPGKKQSKCYMSHDREIRERKVGRRTERASFSISQLVSPLIFITSKIRKYSTP